MAKIGPFRVPRELGDVWAIIRSLSTSLLKLSFADNFDSWETTVTIPKGEELAIRNQFRDGAVPTQYIKVDERGNALVCRGETLWSRDFVYLYNPGFADATVTVVFLR